MDQDKLKLELNSALKKVAQLDSENKKLRAIASSAIQDIKNANDTAENYQRMFDELFNVIKTQYDAEFKIENIPKFLS